MATGYPLSRKHILTHLEPLKFKEDGTFKILHLTDIHKVDPQMDNDFDRSIPENKTKNTLNTIKECIERTNPDLIVFGGDNIGGNWDEITEYFALKSINDILDIVRPTNIPLAIVFGNHDAQNEYRFPMMSREAQMSIYMTYDNFRGCFNEADVFGCGNYHLPIYDSKGEEIKWNIWCMDSNDYPRYDDYKIKREGYDRVHDDQIEWYENTVKAEKEKYGRTIPAILFQHMPVNQELDFMEECEEKDSDYDAGKRFFHAKAGTIKEGLLRETPCPPMDDRSQFEAWVRCGDIKAAFFGHDHTNTFKLELDGIALYQTICAGYETYGDERGGRIITLFENSEKIETETIIVDKKY